MSKMSVHHISDAVNLNVLSDRRFKTIRISVNMLVPMENDTASAYGILPRIVTRATEHYPDYTQLTQKLADLYGATLDCHVYKLGGYQGISIFVEGISNRYAFDQEDMVSELCSLLFSIIENPLKDKDGLLIKDNFLQEKRQVLEVFDSEFNDKIYYAQKKAQEILFDGKPEGLNRYGTREQVENLTLEDVSSAWDKLLRTAKFEVFILGDCKFDQKVFNRTFASLGQHQSYQPEKIDTLVIKDVTDDMPLSQSKLVMGFTADAEFGESDAFKLMAAVYGGTPSSKLFANVREKMSLCYYCSSAFDANTNTMFVQSGVETENIEKARKAILEQLEHVKTSNITEEEIQSAKLAISNSYRSVNDSLEAMENWYLSQVFRPSVKSPEEAVTSIEKIAKEEIVSAANHLTLNTVYVLKGNA
ncbi:EF-P 5-aminopentanol modification-associated protein YfmF [Scatolibacter rhodanostii]|uniref:EF-P 5-aminopentanol modification-associated protein YfmF n=1 Tax=Scatolibacter rhodanostii TaxID=2014781 RepID=UPI000C07658B|nr:insulinase family protein [Scatolibacter rhodanostii]